MDIVHRKGMYNLFIIYRSTFNFLAITVHSTISYGKLEGNSFIKFRFIPFFDEYGDQSMKLNCKVMCKIVNLNN
jgi:hypothetical protein